MIIDPFKFAASPPPGGNPWILSLTLGTLRNNYAGTVGCKFQVGGANISVTDLGRWKVAGNSQSHTLYLFNGAGDTVLASVAVDMSTGSAGGFVYSSITPITLTAGSFYFLVSSETNGGDQWYNDTLYGTVDSFAVPIQSAYGSAASVSGNNDNTVLYVPVNFKAS